MLSHTTFLLFGRPSTPTSPQRAADTLASPPSRACHQCVTLCTGQSCGLAALHPPALATSREASGKRTHGCSAALCPGFLPAHPKKCQETLLCLEEASLTHMSTPSSHCSNSFFSIFVTAPRWSASLLALSPGSTDNFINCGLVASGESTGWLSC